MEIHLYMLKSTQRKKFFEDHRIKRYTENYLLRI